MAALTRRSDVGKVRVLVYGTLKTGQTNHALMEKIRAEFLGYDSITGPFKLKDLGPFPAVFTDTVEGKVKGEIYAMGEEALAHLDFYEGHPNFFERRKFWSDIMKKRVWVYVQTIKELDDVRSKTDLESGLWKPDKLEEAYWANPTVDHRDIS